MKKIASAVSAFILTMTLAVSGFAAADSCCNGSSCCTKGAVCCKAKK